MRYNKHFHQKRVGHPRYPIMADAVLKSYATAFPDLILPDKVADVGCSVGAHLKAIKDLGFDCETLGIDYSVNIDDVLEEVDVYYNLDLTKAIKHSAYGHSDIVICQEVAEHIEAEHTGKVLDFITSLAFAAESLLVFGAAHPGQPGRHHVNCRTKEFWAKCLKKRGWELDEAATAVYLEVLAKGGIIKGCYVDNTQCFTR